MDMTHKDWSSLQSEGAALPRDIKVAIDYMRESIGQQICMADIVAATGTPERTLRKHFLMFFGLAPLRFFLRLRLAAAREALLATSSDSVTDIAARFGFAHFGRFSRDYRRCFGELPSVTRRREDSLPATSGRGEPCRRHLSRPPCLCWSSCPSGHLGIGRVTGSPKASQSCSRRSLRAGQRYASGWHQPLPLRRYPGLGRATA